MIIVPFDVRITPASRSSRGVQLIVSISDTAFAIIGAADQLGLAPWTDMRITVAGENSKQFAFIS